MAKHTTVSFVTPKDEKDIYSDVIVDFSIADKYTMTINLVPRYTPEQIGEAISVELTDCERLRSMRDLIDQFLRDYPTADMDVS